MKRFTRLILPVVAAITFSAGVKAEETMVYDLRISSNFDPSTQFAAGYDRDDYIWKWARYSFSTTDDASGPQMYNSQQVNEPYYADIFMTRDIDMQPGVTYTVVSRPRCYTGNQKAHLILMLGQGTITEGTYDRGELTQIGEYTDIPYVSTYSTVSLDDIGQIRCDFTVPASGKYKVCFLGKGYALSLHDTYIVSSTDTGENPDPDPGTDPDPDPGEDPDPGTDPDPDPGTDPDPNIPTQTVNLPLSDSFAGALLGANWYVEEVSGNVSWEASGELKNQLPMMKEYDNDGGMVVFRAWDGVNGDYARLSSAPISKVSSPAAVIDFMFGHSGARATTDKVKVQVSTDGGEWKDIEGAVIPTYIPEIENGGWTYYKYSLDPYIQGCETYRVGLLGLCENLNANIPVDLINIYNVADKDISISSFDVPESVVAGNELKLSLTLQNLGSTTLNPEDYTIEIESDWPVEIKMEPVAVAPLSDGVISAEVKVSAEEVLDGPDYTFVAKVNVPGNPSGENLTSESKEVTLVFIDYKVPQNAAANFDGDTFTGISWESVKDLDHQAINISENFNDLPEHHQEERTGDDGKTETIWVDGTKGDFNGFISVDLDKQDGGSYYSTSGSEFQVFKDFMTGSMPQGHSGKYIGLTLPGNTQQDDWLISPALDAAEGSVINFWARIAYIHRESDSYNNSLEVLYATEDYNRNNPAPSFKKSILTNTSKASTGTLPHDGLYHWLYVNGIPSEAKYVALHFITKSGMQTGVWIDRLSVTETDLYPMKGYNVYQRNVGLLNDRPLDITQLEYALTGASLDADRPYYVTALYDDGESAPSNMVSSASSGFCIEPAVYGVVIKAINGGVMLTGAAGETAVVYTPEGRIAASASCSAVTVINLPAGLYIVKAGSTAAKVMVR